MMLFEHEVWLMMSKKVILKVEACSLWMFTLFSSFFFHVVSTELIGTDATAPHPLMDPPAGQGDNPSHPSIVSPESAKENVR